MDSIYTMRQPCKYCSSVDGRIETRAGQDCVFCLSCDRHNYNAPRTETGREVRTLRTRPNISVSQRARVLDRDGGLCVICHTPGRPVDAGHIVSVDEGRQLDMTDVELFSDENLAAMCSSCNSGYSSVSINPRIFLALVRARLARGAA